LYGRWTCLIVAEPSVSRQFFTVATGFVRGAMAVALSVRCANPLPITSPWPKVMSWRPIGSKYRADRRAPSLEDILDTVHVFPTCGEAIKLAALSFFEDIDKLSCCAL